MGSRDHSIECEACGMQRGGFDDLPCDCDARQLSEAFLFSLTEDGEELLDAMRTLSQNLRWGAALCRAFDLGKEWSFNVCSSIDEIVANAWKHGCGKAAP